MVADQAAAVGQRARSGLLLDGREEGIPDHPGIDTAALEGGAGVGGRQKHQLDLARLQAGFVHQLDEQVVHVRALVERDPAALQIGHRFQRRILAHHHGLGGGRGQVVGDVDHVGTRRLREDRRRFADIAEVDAADVERFEHLRPAGEFDPSHRGALRGQLLVEQAARFHQHQRAVLLKTDAQLGRLGTSLRKRRHADRQREREASGHDNAAAA